MKEYKKYEHKDITKELLDTIKVNDFVKINTWERPMKVIAVSENFIIMWRKHFKTFAYSILEKFKRGYSHNLVYDNCGFSFDDFVCGQDNSYCKFDYSNKEECEQALKELENGDLEVSTRHGWGVYHIEIKKVEEEKMNKRQAKKKGKNRTIPPSIPLDKFLKRIDKTIRKPYHDCFLPMEYVIDEEEIDENNKKA